MTPPLAPTRRKPRPPRPLSPADKAKLASASVDVRRCLLFIAQARLVTGAGPRLNELWSVWHYGHMDAPARAGQADVVSKLDGKLRPPKADAQHLLRYLAHEWFVRYANDEQGSIKLRGAVYQWLAPAARQLPIPDAWPRRRRFRQ